MPVHQPDDRLRHTLVTTASGLLAVAATLAWWMLERYELALEPEDRTYRETVGSRSAYAAWVALDDGRNADAMHLYERALELVELEGEHWHNYGVALDRLERPDDAAAAYAKARELGLRP